MTPSPVASGTCARFKAHAISDAARQMQQASLVRTVSRSQVVMTIAPPLNVRDNALVIIGSGECGAAFLPLQYLSGRAQQMEPRSIRIASS
jgi:hypothetical protein